MFEHCYCDELYELKEKAATFDNCCIFICSSCMPVCVCVCEQREIEQRRQREREREERTQQTSGGDKAIVQLESAKWLCVKKEKRKRNEEENKKKKLSTLWDACASEERAKRKARKDAKIMSVRMYVYV